MVRNYDDRVGSRELFKPAVILKDAVDDGDVDQRSVGGRGMKEGCDRCVFRKKVRNTPLP